MAPTEVLAEQHFRSLSQLLAPAGVRVGLLTGSMRTAERQMKQLLKGQPPPGQLKGLFIRWKMDVFYGKLRCRQMVVLPDMLGERLRQLVGAREDLPGQGGQQVQGGVSRPSSVYPYSRPEPGDGRNGRRHDIGPDYEPACPG